MAGQPGEAATWGSPTTPRCRARACGRSLLLTVITALCAVSPSTRTCRPGLGRRIAYIAKHVLMKQGLLGARADHLRSAACWLALPQRQPFGHMIVQNGDPSAWPALTVGNGGK